MNYILLYECIFITGLVSTFAALIVSVIKGRRKRLTTIQLLLLVSFLADLIIAIADYIFNSYVSVGRYYRLIELILLLEFFRLLFAREGITYLIRVLQVILPIGIIIFFSFDSAPFRITSSIAFSCFAVIYFRMLISEMKIEDPRDFPLFWINSAILIYFSGCLFLFLFFEPLAKLHEMSAVISYIFHNILLVIRNILISMGFWKTYNLKSAQM